MQIRAVTSPGTVCQRPCHTVAEDLAETQMRIFAESVCDSIMTFSKSLSFSVSFLGNTVKAQNVEDPDAGSWGGVGEATRRALGFRAQGG